MQDSSVAKGVKGIQNKESIGTDLNHRLPRFMELKEEWLKRNIKK